MTVLFSREHGRSPGSAPARQPSGNAPTALPWRSPTLRSRVSAKGKTSFDFREPLSHVVLKSPPRSRTRILPKCQSIGPRLPEESRADQDWVFGQRRIPIGNRPPWLNSLCAGKFRRPPAGLIGGMPRSCLCQPVGHDHGRRCRAHKADRGAGLLRTRPSQVFLTGCSGGSSMRRETAGRWLR